VKEHRLAIRCLAYSPDGRVIATGGGDGDVRLWEAATRKPLAELEGHTNYVKTLAFSPDGKTLATGCDDRTVKLWDVSSGKERATFADFDHQIYALAFSPDGALLAVAVRDSRTILLLDATNGRVRDRFQQPKGVVSVALAFAPDGKTLASGEGGERYAVTLWDVQTGRPQTVLRGHTDSVLTVAFSRDGKLLASGSLDWTARLWRVAEGKPAALLRGHRWRVDGVRFDPDGERLVTIGGHTLRTWDVAQALKEGVKGDPFGIDGENSIADCAALSPDGKTCAVAGGRAGRDRFDKPYGELVLWDVETRKQRLVIRQERGSILAAAFSPDGKAIATGGVRGEASLWDATTGKLLARFEGHWGTVTQVAFAPDGKHLITGGNEDCSVRVWEIESGKQQRAFRFPYQKNAWQQSEEPPDLPRAQAEFTLAEPIWAISYMALAPDGKVVAVAGSDPDGVKLLNLETAQLIPNKIPVDRGFCYRLAYSPDGKVLALGRNLWDAKIEFWDLGTATMKGECAGHSFEVTWMAFSPDGKRLVSAGRYDGVKVWDVSTGKERFALEDSGERYLRALGFTPDGKGLLTVGPPSLPAVWDLSTGKPRP
jgi:WD40 repeat protein